VDHGLRGVLPPFTATRVAAREPLPTSPEQGALLLSTAINTADEGSLLDFSWDYDSEQFGGIDLDREMSCDSPSWFDLLPTHEAATESPWAQSPQRALEATTPVSLLTHPRFARMRELAERVNVPLPNEQDGSACAAAWYNSEAMRHLQLIRQAPDPEIKAPLLVLWFAKYCDCHVPESVLHLAQRLCMAYGESTTAEEEEEQQEFNHRNCLLLDFSQANFEEASLGGERLITRAELHGDGLLLPPRAWSDRLLAIARLALMNDGFAAQAVGAARFARDAERMSARSGGGGRQERWNEFGPRIERVLSNTDSAQAHAVLASAWWRRSSKTSSRERCCGCSGRLTRRHGLVVRKRTMTARSRRP